MSFWPNVIWATVFLGKCLCGQISSGQIPSGKRLLGKCLSGQMSFWANVSGQMSLGKCRKGKRHRTKKKPNQPVWHQCAQAHSSTLNIVLFGDTTFAHTRFAQIHLPRTTFAQRYLPRRTVLFGGKQAVQNGVLRAYEWDFGTTPIIRYPKKVLGLVPDNDWHLDDSNSRLWFRQLKTCHLIIQSSLASHAYRRQYPGCRWCLMPHRTSFSLRASPAVSRTTRCIRPVFKDWIHQMCHLLNELIWVLWEGEWQAATIAAPSACAGAQQHTLPLSAQLSVLAM
jgi:hypothetical protein